MSFLRLCCLVVPALFASCATHSLLETKPNESVAYLAAGCYWCVEAVFERIPGVTDVASGFAEGTSGSAYRPGKIETVRIIYDTTKVSYEDLLTMFWRSHDPTTLDRQGPDVGAKYRSAIFYQNAREQTLAELSKREAQAGFDRPIVTEIRNLAEFTPVRVDQQDYYEKNPAAPYCRMIIGPKLKKLGLEP